MLLKRTHKNTLSHEPVRDIPSRVLPYILMVLRRDPRLWLFLLVTDMIHGLRYPLAFFWMGRIVDLLGAAPQGVVPLGVWQNTGLLFATLFLGELAHLIPHYFTFDWWKRARGALRSDLLNYTLGHSHAYFQNQFAGALARKISEGVEKALELNPQFRWEIFLPLINMTCSGVVLFSVAPLYGGFVALFVLAIMTPTILKVRKIRQKSQAFADARSAVTGQIVDTLTNMSAVKSYAHESLEMAAHKAVCETEMKAWHKMLRVFLLLDNYRRMTLVLFGTSMMVACVLGWKHGALSLGEISTIMGISFNFTALAWNLGFGIVHVSESLGTLNDSLSILITPHQVKDAPHAPALNVTAGEIMFKDVGFDYAGSPVFQHLNLTIPAGQKLGLIGPSGAGKSTFVNLIQRFFDVSENDGGIFIDGQNIAHVTQKSLRRAIAVIPQDTALFHRSIRENIRYGRHNASDAEILDAATKACALEFIESLPQGFDTVVGERGVKLSGGQRQRIAIARAILKNAPLLILDEATSALDSESEHHIQSALKTLMQGKTVIAIAHRLSTIHHLDRLLVMERGQIIEDGTHEGLLRQNGLYHKLWTMQSGGFLPE